MAEWLRKLDDLPNPRELMAPLSKAELRYATEIKNAWPRLLGIARAAEDVAATDWRTSVPEMEHFARIDKMERLRAALKGEADE